LSESWHYWHWFSCEEQLKCCNVTIASIQRSFVSLKYCTCKLQGTKWTIQYMLYTFVY
jgi:hypothetical protein